MGIYDYAYIALWISFFRPTASKLDYAMLANVTEICNFL